MKIDADASNPDMTESHSAHIMSVLADVSLCEGFRTTALARGIPGDWGRRPKPSSEGTRGDGGGPVRQGLWRLMAADCDRARRSAAGCSASRPGPGVGDAVCTV